MRIHAFAAQAPGAEPEPFDYELTKLGPSDVDVKVSHCGICHSDIHLIDNDWGISHYPLVPGHEIVGTVAATGEEIEQLSIGERVGVVGIGGLGHLALQFPHAMGCEVTAFSTSPEKKDDAAAFGADHFVMSRDPPQMRNAARTACQIEDRYFRRVPPL